MTKAVFMETPIGRIGVAERNGAVTNVFFGKTVQPKDFVEEETPLLCRAKEQLAEYFAGKRRAFDLPLRAEGTDFERACWEALLTIPCGETKTYGEIAAQIGRPKAVRAVGRANGRNPISILIPCHRVIGKDGTLTGYAGGVDAKARLLALEKSTI